MADFDAILKCSVGNTSLRVVDYRVSDQPRSSSGREIACAVRAEIVLRPTGTETDAEVAASQVAAVAAIKAAAGKDFSITGPGDVVLFQLLRSQCRDGGPHVSLELDEMGDAGLTDRKVSFTVASDRSAASTSTGGGGGGTSLVVRVTKTGDGLGTITQSGSLTGSGLSDAAVEQQAFAPFTAVYGPPHYAIVAREYELNADASEATYQISAVPLATPYPAVAGATEIVDGEATRTVERDDRMLKTVRYELDLLLSGPDYQPVLDEIRPDGVIQRESYTVTLHKENRLRATFTVLEGGNGTQVTEWRQDVRIVGGAGTVEERRYAGLPPILVAAPAATALVYQSGTSVAVGAAVRPPPPLDPERLATAPEVDYSERGIGVWVTSWSYVMFAEQVTLSQQPDFLASLLARPTEFEFVTGVGTQPSDGRRR